MAALSLAGAGLGAFLVVGRAEAAPETRKVVRQVDHVLISSSQPNALFALLTQTFELPVAWPMSDYGGFVSGGVALGNVNVEVLSAAGPAGGVARARFVGLALEPEPLPTALPELDARGIVHGRPAPYRTGRSWFTRKPRWTTVALPTVSADALEVFLCEYGHDVAEQRQRLREQLQSRQGGPLSVRSVREIVCGTAHRIQKEESWRTLLHPSQASDGQWELGGGPALRLVQAERDQLQELIVTVGSLQQARVFLREQGLLGEDRPEAITLAGPLLQGLTLVLVEEPWER